MLQKYSKFSRKSGNREIMLHFCITFAQQRNIGENMLHFRTLLLEQWQSRETNSMQRCQCCIREPVSTRRPVIEISAKHAKRRPQGSALFPHREERVLHASPYR